MYQAPEKKHGICVGQGKEKCLFLKYATCLFVERIQLDWIKSDFSTDV